MYYKETITSKSETLWCKEVYTVHPKYNDWLRSINEKKGIYLICKEMRFSFSVYLIILLLPRKKQIGENVLPGLRWIIHFGNIMS